MTNFLFSFFVFLSLLVAVRIDSESYEDALAVSRSEGRPIYIVFKGEGCGWCDLQSRDMLKPEVIELMDGFVFCEVDVEFRRDLSKKYGVRKIPAHRIVDSNGNILKSKDGYLKPGQISSLIEAYH